MVSTPIKSDLPSLMDFRIDPAISPSVKVETITEQEGYYPFDQVLNNVDSSIFVIKNQKLVGFILPVGQMFLELGRKIVGYHQNNQFIGDLMHRVRISPFWDICIPFGSISGHNNDLEVGIYWDVRHLRRMVASLILKFFPMSDYSTFVSLEINLFFSPIYLNHSRMYSTFQFLHPIFYNSEDRIKFINVVREYSFHRQDIYWNLLLGESAYKVSNWQEKVKSASSKKIYKQIFNRGMAKHSFYKNAGGLPLYIRDVHYHFEKGKHEVADRQINEWFPGICAKVLDALIRTLHHTWTTKEDEENFTKYLTREPYGFAPTAPPS